MIIDSIQNGIVIDHISAGKARKSGQGLLLGNVYSGRFSLYVLANTFIPPNNHDFASLRRCSFTRNHAK